METVAMDPAPQVKPFGHEVAPSAPQVVEGNIAFIKPQLNALPHPAAEVMSNLAVSVPMVSPSLKESAMHWLPLSAVQAWSTFP
jgi:hypothetical protein